MLGNVDRHDSNKRWQCVYAKMAEHRLIYEFCESLWNAL